MDYSDLAKKGLVVRREGPVAIATLDRPAKLNAINDGLHTAIEELFSRVGNDRETRALVLTGAGRAFSAGGDVKGGYHEGSADPEAAGDPLRIFRNARAIIMRMLECQVPTVAAINGVAAGLGATIALLCDVTFMADTARIGDTHTKVGLVAGDGGAVIWPWLVGPHRARELLMAGELISAAEADRIGLVNHVVPADRLMGEALAWAAKIAAMAPYAVRATKMAINRNILLTAMSSMDLALSLEVTSATLDDFREATSALIEKRAPKFSGR